MRFNAALCVALALAVSSPGVSAQSTDVQTRWAGTWGASPSPQLADNAAMEKAKLTFTNQTIREIVHISIGGSTIRVRLSNTYGKDAVEIGAAHVALRSKASAIVSGSDHQLTFGGHSSITIPPNALVLSDPLPINLASSSDLAISIFLPKSTLGAGIHYAAQQTNYIGSGDLTTAVDMPDATTITSWVFLSGVDVSATQPSSALITFGDSITDGARSANDTNHRWPDFLATRLLAQKSTARIGVLNEGIGGNRILHDPNEEIRFGVNALARFDRDVLSQPGVKYIIVMEGINDLGHAGPDHFPTEQVTAEDLIVGYKQLIARAHERGIKIYGATMTPFTGVTFNGYYSDQKELIRKSVNTWMRTSHAFDAVIDFDKAVQDRADPDHIAAAYDSGDHLHPKDEGYKAMADSIDLSLFK